MNTKCPHCDQDLYAPVPSRHYCPKCTPLVGAAISHSAKEASFLKQGSWLSSIVTYSETKGDLTLASPVMLRNEPLYYCRSLETRQFVFGPTPQAARDALLEHLLWKRRELPITFEFSPFHGGYSVTFGFGTKGDVTEYHDHCDTVQEVRAHYEYAVDEYAKKSGAAIPLKIPVKKIPVKKIPIKRKKAQQADYSTDAGVAVPFHNLFVWLTERQMEEEDCGLSTLELNAYSVMRREVRAFANKAVRVSKFSTEDTPLTHYAALLAEKMMRARVRLPSRLDDTLVLSQLAIDTCPNDYRDYLQTVIRGGGRAKYLHTKERPQVLGPVGQLVQALQDTGRVVCKRYFGATYVTSVHPEDIRKAVWDNYSPTEIVQLFFLGELPKEVRRCLDDEDFVPAKN